jgi:endonuclease V-like protein UPF0215 family
VRRLSHAIGFDDAPFERSSRGNVLLVGAVFAGPRLDGVLTGTIRRDGANSADAMAEMITRSRFAEHLQIILLQGIAVGGFNVVDVFRLHRRTSLPIIVVARRRPNLDAVRDALLGRVRGGARKWRIIERLGAMERIGTVWTQRIGISAGDAASALARFAVHSTIPEPLRVAHIIAGGIVRGESRGRV